MSERYTKRFALTEQELPPIANIPVKIKAGALLQDNLQGVVLAQIKYENISNKSIKEMRVNIFAYDGQGSKIESLSNYTYERLSANVGDFFGDNLPVVLPDNNTYGFNVEVVSVEFSDGTMWNKFDEQAKLAGKETIKVASAIGKEVGKESVKIAGKGIPILWKIFSGFINLNVSIILIAGASQIVADMTYGFGINKIIAFILLFGSIILSIPQFARRILFKKKFGLKERVLRWVIIIIMFIIGGIISPI